MKNCITSSLRSSSSVASICTASLFLIVISVLFLARAAFADDSKDVVAQYLHAGDLTVEAGGLFIFHRYEGEKDEGSSAGFVQLKYEAPITHGFGWGAWWFGLKRAWENHPGDYAAVVTTESSLRELYALYDIPRTKTRVQAGRFYMRDTAIDGNSHQGAQVVSRDIPRMQLKAGAIERWSKYNRVHPNFLGMTGWSDTSSLHEEAGNWFWFGSARADLGATGFIEPFVRYQENVMFVQGGNWDFGVDFDAGYRLGLDGTVARYGNEWPRELQPEYEDVYAWLLHGYWEQNNVRLGLGWHGVSRHNGHLGAGLFFWIDPLTVDETIPYDDRNDSEIYYADAHIRRESWRLILRYGYGIARPISVYSHEVNVFGFVDLTPSVTWGTLISANRYSGDLLANYTRIGMTLTYAY